MLFWFELQYINGACFCLLTNALKYFSDLYPGQLYLVFRISEVDRSPHFLESSLVVDQMNEFFCLWVSKRLHLYSKENMMGVCTQLHWKLYFKCLFLWPPTVCLCINSQGQVGKAEAVFREPVWSLRVNCLSKGLGKSKQRMPALSPPLHARPLSSSLLTFHPQQHWPTLLGKWSSRCQQWPNQVPECTPESKPFTFASPTPHTETLVHWDQS